MKKIKKKYLLNNENEANDILLDETNPEYIAFLSEEHKSDDEIEKFRYIFLRLTKDFIKYFKNIFKKDKNEKKNDQIQSDLEFQSIIDDETKIN